MSAFNEAWTVLKFRTGVLCQKCQGPADDGKMVGDWRAGEGQWLCKQCAGFKDSMQRFFG